MDETTRTSRAAARDRGSYALWASDIVRYKDLDRQDHVNNAVYATYFETGRVKYFRDPALGLLGIDETFVLVRLEIDFLAELHYPGSVEIGTCIVSAGRSSFRLAQAIFQGERCFATAEVVTALLDAATRAPKPLTPSITAWLAETTERQR